MCLQKAYAGDYSSPSLLPVPVSLTKTGYPRIIPSFLLTQKKKNFDTGDSCSREQLSRERMSLYIDFFDFYYPSLRPKRVYEIKKDVLEGFVAAKAF